MQDAVKTHTSDLEPGCSLTFNGYSLATLVLHRHSLTFLQVSQCTYLPTHGYFGLRVNREAGLLASWRLHCNRVGYHVYLLDGATRLRSLFWFRWTSSSCESEA